MTRVKMFQNQIISHSRYLCSLSIFLKQSVGKNYSHISATLEVLIIKMADNLNCEESSSAPHPQEEASQNSQVDERQAFVLLTFLLFHALNSILNEDVLFE